MIPCELHRLFLIFFLIFCGASAIDSMKYVSLISEVHAKFVRSFVFLLHHEIDGLKEIKQIGDSIRSLSAKGVNAVSMNFEQLVDSDVLRRTQNRPLLVVIIESTKEVATFLNFTDNFRMSYPIWLLILNDDVESLSSTHLRQENILHLRFDTQMYVFRENSSNIEEWYAIGNETRMMDIATWNVDDGLVLLSQKRLYERRNDLENSTIVVAVAEEPSAASYHNRTINRLFLEILEQLGTVLNFNIKIVSPPDSWLRSRQSQKSRWNSVIAILEAGEADITTMDMLMTASRARLLDFTHPLLFSFNKLYIRQPDGGIRWSGYLKIFSLNIWGAIGISILLTALITRIAVTVRGDDLPGKSFTEDLLLVLGIYCQQGLAKFPSPTPLKIAYICAFFSAVVVSAAYSASLISYLTVQDGELPFSTFEGFVADGSYKLIVFGNSADYDTFARAKESTQSRMFPMMKPITELPLTLSEALHDVCAGKTAFFTQQARIDMMKSYAPCKLAAVGADLIAHQGMPMSKNNPFYGVINFYIKRFRYAGMFHRAKYLYWSRSNVTFKTFNEVGVDAVAPIFTALAAGLALSGILLVIEHTFVGNHLTAIPKTIRWILFAKNWQKNHRRRSTYSSNE